MKNALVTISLILLILAGCSKKDAGTEPTLQKSESSKAILEGGSKKVLYWYDPMSPAQKFDKPGKSPFMDMQLVAKYATDGNAENAGVAISSQTVQNLGIRFEKVGMKSFGELLAAVGRIEPDERRISVAQTRTPGFVERLTVRAVGDPVSKGQKVAEIYAPEILAAQQEYLALLPLSQIDADNTLKQAARSRLKLLGMSEGEVDGITKSNKPSARFGVYSPASGVVTALGVREGGQLMSGASLMQLSDLSNVWLIAEVPERDTARLKLGLLAEVRLESIPGEIFKGKVSYLYPTLNDASRSLQVRIELPNKNYQLRPGMYANISFTGQTHEALAIPTESVIETGKRKVVIVKSQNGYRTVEVVTGQERDSHIEVLKGISEGEEVVTSGQFLIDSEASLSGVLARLSKQDASIIVTNGPEIVADEKLPQKTAKSRPKGYGKVVGIDLKRSKITLAHEAIAQLNWPAMTMDFSATDPKQLAKLKVNDTVEFHLKDDAQEEYVIVQIEKSADKKNGLKRVQP
ncbi:MAG: efflux RND transporter periplasmic adaptor subunit [Betaproteobacteria bacterium]